MKRGGALSSHTPRIGEERQFFCARKMILASDSLSSLFTGTLGQECQDALLTASFPTWSSGVSPGQEVSDLLPRIADQIADRVDRGGVEHRLQATWQVWLRLGR